MTLKQLNEEYGNLKFTAEALEKGTKNVENYLNYDVLYKARECVISSMDRFINKDWK